jgi:ATP-dependent 26S proteasome regulatory subunit
MTVDDGVNWAELARSTDEYNGAMLKAVCVEAGIARLALVRKLTCRDDCIEEWGDED